MAGLDVVRQVNGLYPIIGDAIVASRDAESAKRALRTLKIEKVAYNCFVSKLLSPHLSRSAFKALKELKEGEAFNWDASVEPSLRLRFGASTADVLLATLADIRKLFEQLQKDVDSINDEKQNKLRLGFLRARHGPPRSPLQKRLKQLTAYNVDLGRVFTDDFLSSTSVRYSGRRRPSCVHRKRASKYKALHNAIGGNYHCSCDSEHLANLGLGSVDFKASGSDSDSNPDDDQCQLVFYVQDEKDSDAMTLASRTRSLVSSQQNSISDHFCQSPLVLSPVTSNSDRQRSSTRTSQSSNSRRWSSLPTPDQSPIRVHLRPRAVSISESNDHNGEAITNLCDYLLNEDFSRGLLIKDEKKYQFQVAITGEDPISLQEWLEGSKLSRQDRVELAINLTRAVLSLHNTPWLPKSWSYRDFQIQLSEHTGPESPNSQLFISTSFYSTKRKPPTTSTMSEWSLHEPILTRLGFALTELGISRRLYDFHNRDNSFETNTDMKDFFTAQEILKSGVLRKEQGKDYEIAVNACLNHQFWRENGFETINSQMTDFHDIVERYIITPLYNTWEKLWGTEGA